MKKYLYLLLSFLLFVEISHAQIRLSSIKVDEWVKKNFTGQGVVVGNIKVKGYPLSTLSYTSTGNVLKLQKGLILSSGNSYNVAGYNNSHNQSSTFGDVMNPESDQDLASIIKGKLYDICSIEFDFVPLDNSIQFNYQFGSDEYPEYVDSPYNDVFAFIVSDESTSRNIALIPGTQVPVSINTVNFKTNSEHFIDNNLYKQVTIKRQEPLKSTYKGTLPGRVLRGIGSIFTVSGPIAGDQVVVQPDPELMKTLDPNLYRNLRYDGITNKLVAQAYVIPYKKYRLKIILADVADNIYDSGVFIEDRSLTSKKDVQQPNFTDYPDLSKVIDPNLILQGKKLEDILPDAYKKELSKPALQTQELAQTSKAPVSVQKVAEPAPVSSPKAVSASPPTTAAAQVKVAIKPVLMDMPNIVILFDFDRSDIKESEMIKLREAIEKFKKQRQYYSLNISGHTDIKGSLEYNYDLSARRNKAVIDAVSDLIGEKMRIPAVSKSYTQPVADNETDDGRQANRRVELVFVKKN
ncbi:Outer membrane protein OmpA [Daejeonella rubra]|uniref:Outer membrane protein OmpA n=1 Tax=Daejeonella rubra TaxID=990371 RepID=A0A1G9YTX8_9SPHI|nr:OmpA family protein [Daejeonella rubra]SDN12592.1 Outer membrane protein OmpA [Daejeonella rubra]